MKAALLSDLHIGASKSKWKDAARLITRIAPDLDVILIVGDITEELNPYQHTLNLSRNFETHRKRVQNGLNQFIAKISDYSNRIVFLKGNHDDLLLNNFSLVQTYAVLRSPFGRIIAIHGHLTNLTKFGLRYGWGIEAGRHLKREVEKEAFCGIRLKPTDFLIVGHCHVTYSDPTLKIYSPGCWVGDYTNRNVGWYIHIDDESVDTSKAFIQLKRNVPSAYHRQKCKCGFNQLKIDDLSCPACGIDLMPRCEEAGCYQSLRGEDIRKCKKHFDTSRYYE